MSGRMSRPLMVAERMRAQAGPLGRTPRPKAKADERMMAFVNAVAGGQIPLDETAAEIVARVLDQQLSQMKDVLPK